MSIEIDWHHLTAGPDGEALSESIRAFIHDRFQQVQLPRFIRSVKAHSFQFGNTAPQVEVKDICDPLPDFYESENEDENLDEDATGDGGDEDESEHVASSRTSGHVAQAQESNARSQRPQLSKIATLKQPEKIDSASSPVSMDLPRGTGAGIPGGTSNMSYFHLPLSAGLSGASTPIGTSGSRFGGSLFSHLQHNSSSSNLRRSMSPPSEPLLSQTPVASAPLKSPPADQGATDLQIVAHLKYDGDVKLALTAEVMFDYPMQSFVGIPLQLNVTGLTFDGVAVLAYIKHKAHFCFLAPEDADALIGGESGGVAGHESPEVVDVALGPDQPPTQKHLSEPATADRKPVGGLFEEIRIESAIGERDQGRQVLKNIGKVEKFVLDQVRRIFESELVYPSFWTFLV